MDDKLLNLRSAALSVGLTAVVFGAALAIAYF